MSIDSIQILSLIFVIGDYARVRIGAIYHMIHLLSYNKHISTGDDYKYCLNSLKFKELI